MKKLSTSETMDSARAVPVEPAGSDSGFRVVDVQQRVKAAKLPKKQDPLDHVDSPDKVREVSYQALELFLVLFFLLGR
jgi:hypothetical protein